MHHRRAAALIGVCAGVFFGVTQPRTRASFVLAEPSQAALGSEGVRRYPLSESIPNPADPGASNIVRALLEPAALELVGESERMQVHVLLENQLETPARVKYALELVDDRGRGRHLETQSPTVIVTGRARHSEVVLGVPEQLPDGYYTLTLTAAAADRRYSGVALDFLYLSIRHGKVVPLDPEEYFTESKANLAVAQ
ncbi:MAG: hypothetical protein R6X02_17490 [Enhygromyxa sp.]